MFGKYFGNLQPSPAFRSSGLTNPFGKHFGNLAIYAVFKSSGLKNPFLGSIVENLPTNTARCLDLPEKSLWVGNILEIYQKNTYLEKLPLIVLEPKPPAPPCQNQVLSWLQSAQRHGGPKVLGGDGRFSLFVFLFLFHLFLSFIIHHLVKHKHKRLHWFPSTIGVTLMVAQLQLHLNRAREILSFK